MAREAKPVKKKPSKPAKASAKPAKPGKAPARPAKAPAATSEVDSLRRALADREARLLMLEAQASMLEAKLQVMREVARTSSSDFSLPEMLELFMDVVLEATHTDAGSLLLVEEGGLRFTVVRGPKSERLKGQLLPHDEGICGWVARTGEPALTENPQRDSRHSARISQEIGYEAHNILAVPLKGRAGVLGVLQLLNREGGKPFSHDDMASLESLAVQIAMVLENARLFENHQHEIKRLTSLTEASLVLNSTLDLKRLLKLVMELAARTLDAEASSILLRDKKTGDLVFEVATGEKQDVVSTIRVPVGEGIAGWVALNSQSLLVPDVSRDPRFFKKADEKTRFITRDILAVPMTLQGQLIGVAEVLNKRQGRFTLEDQRLLEALASQSSIAIQNAGLYADLQESFLATVRSLAQAIDAKDSYTAGHATRVSSYTEAICREMGVEPELAGRMRLSALMHDVGKIGVPEAVLCKPGRLTDEEFAAMRRHPAIGAGILGPIEQLADVIPGIRSHHERWDGRGYPEGLIGEAIPQVGRIIGVADSFDAMTSNRIYRPRLSDEVAIEELKKNSGSQFDPRAVEAFLAAYAKGSVKTDP